jgi:RNA polymerase sigma-70 factor (ECF subfamily)
MRAAVLESVHKGLPDVEIARRIAAGDQDAFCLLMRRYNQTLYRAARSILKDDAEAEDAVQEAYLLAYRAMGKFRGDAKRSTGLVRIVVNEAIARSRKRVRRAACCKSRCWISPSRFRAITRSTPTCCRRRSSSWAARR